MQKTIHDFLVCPTGILQQDIADLNRQGDKKLKSKLRQIAFRLKAMDENVLVSITVSRKKGEISYKIDCAKGVKSEELAHYLDEIIEGICTWKPEVCEETIQSIVGIIPDTDRKFKTSISE